MVKSYKILIYAQDGKSVINVGHKSLQVDELQIDVPSWGEYDVQDKEGKLLAQFVIACKGKAQIDEARNGNDIYRKCRIVEG